MIKFLMLLLFMSIFFPAVSLKASSCSSDDISVQLNKGNNSSNEYYSENYMFSFFNTSPYKVYAEIVISNLGLGDGKLAVTFNFTLPNKKKFVFKHKFSKGQWKTKSDTLYIKAPGLLLKQQKNNGHKVYILQINDKSFSTRLTFVPVAKCYKPSFGTIWYDKQKKDFYKNILISPRAHFNGTVVLKDKKKYNFNGLTYIEHSLSNILPNKQAKEWYRFRVLTNNYCIVFKRITTENNGKIIYKSFFYAEKNSKIVADQTDATIYGKNFFTDSKSNRQYKVPQEIIINTPLIKGIVKATSLYLREYFLDQIGFFLKMIIEKYSEPITYNFNCRYLFIINAQQVFEGNGRFYISKIY